jgi:glucose/arabinose dehydrogenase
MTRRGCRCIRAQSCQAAHCLCNACNLSEGFKRTEPCMPHRLRFRRLLGALFFGPTALVSAIVAATALAGAPVCANAQGGVDTERGAALFREQCEICHGAPASGGAQGPDLAGVLGRRAGSASFGYSRAMRHAVFTWDLSRLDAFLAEPAAIVPGTSMPARVEDPGERHALIAFLATLQASATGARSEPAISPSINSGPPQPGVLLVGRAAFGDWRSDAPGVRRRIAVADLPPPFATPSAGNAPSIVDRPDGAVPLAPPGFHVTLFASGLEHPRLITVAPDGDVFVAETAAGRIRVLRAGPDGARAVTSSIFARDLDAPFGIAFYPSGASPHWIYIAETNAVIRVPYRNGDVEPRGDAQTIIPRLSRSSGGHITRDIAFSLDDARLFVSVGSSSNIGRDIGVRSVEAAHLWEASHGLGAAWGADENRADVLSFTPDGKDGRTFATGLRNCVGLAVQPVTGQVWCSTNERDGLGDDLVPDYVTRVRQGAFYGWPWYYLGDHEDPRLRGQRPDLAGKVTVPDVLLQSHSASLEMAFYAATSFPPAYRGIFAAEHGSWNRARRTGYKVIFIPLDLQGQPTGEYDDFLTGFVVDADHVWGRPVGVAVARDGALLVSEDSNGTIWRVAYGSN